MTFSNETYNLRIELDTKHCECTPEQIQRMERALGSLDRMTKDFPVSDLYVTIVHHPRTGDFHVKTALVLSGRTLFTGERHREMYPAYEKCIDKLRRKVSAYKSRLSADDELAKTAKGTLQEIVPTQLPDHEAILKAVQEEDYLAFRSATSMYEEAVRKRIGRWLQRYPELNQRIGDGLEIADLEEDVFLTAFEYFGAKPADQPPGVWLESLIDEVLHEVAEHPERELENISMVRSAGEIETNRES